METKEKLTLLYGTGNAAKLEIMKRYLAGFDKIRLVGLKDMNCEDVYKRQAQRGGR